MVVDIPVEITDIIDKIPSKLLSKELGVTQRIADMWKSGSRGMSEQHQRRALKLKDLSKRIEKGSYEAEFGSEIIKPIRLNRKDFDLKLTDHYADIIYFGDYHYGHPQCNEKLAEETIRYSLDYNIPIILMGDIMEIGTKGSPGDSIFTQKLLQKQIDYVEEIFTPHAEKGLLWGYVKGNHEDRINKNTGVDICRLLCKLLKIPYLHGACWHLHKVGGEFYSVYTLHGSSGATFTWTKLGAYVKVAQNFDCDLLVGAHVHELGNTVIKRQGINYNRDGVGEFVKHVVMTGGYLKYDLSYGQDKGYGIPTLGSVKVRFYADEHKITVHDVFQGKESKPREWREKEK